MENSPIAVCGLGQMGLPVAARLAGGFDVTAFDLNADRRRLAATVDRIETTDDLTRLADCNRIVLSLPAPAVSRSVIAELTPHLSAGTVVVETSTVLPGDVRGSAALLAAAGASLIDAAILSGVVQMESGTATLLVGGSASDIERVADVLSVLGGAGWSRFGDLGSGMAAKVVNNAVAHAVMVVLVEAFAMAQAEGLDLADIATMFERPDGGLIRPLTHRICERVATGAFEGGMPLNAARKDSTLALAMAQASGVPLFATQACQSVYDLAVAAGSPRDDYAAIARLWESWTGSTLTFDVTQPRDER
ncbi:NAD(P)-dependent oxidoreductase [Mycolicibacterium sp. S2-37]|uniref:NAD(P)-dependent oxidoreductase n=1 Tax=Mycolicibacterium sp. S2-37 TaxID=2810297 RepID=UPI001A94E6E8|nr:NAD(P)-dependent oxidoreductase [Mycolicibacterium sp. S2-37]MBO0679652.1 NAD(P)-dependent oxidoreductase [Mycolicibacterium sp. S2-37]